MQLGAILTASPGEPCATKEVEFRIMRKTGQGRKVFRVKSVLLPVSEADRQAAKRDAIAYLRTTPEYADKADTGSYALPPPIPASVVEQEAVYKFLASALHDVDNPLVKFLATADYHLFREGVIGEQVAWLNGVYNKFIGRRVSRDWRAGHGGPGGTGRKKMRSRPLLAARLLASTPQEWLGKPVRGHSRR